MAARDAMVALAPGFLELDQQVGCELRVFHLAFGRIAAWVGHDARGAHKVIATVVHVAVQPKAGLPAQDLRFQVGDKAGVQRRADKLRRNAAR